MTDFNNQLVPMVIERTSGGERSFDIFSRLLRDRVIMINGQVDTNMASVVTAQLLMLEADDPSKDITMYINSPGGSVYDGLAIIDTMNFIKPDVSTVVVGMAASMGSAFLSAGATGKRFALPNSRIMIHQVLGGARGQVTDMRIQVDEADYLKVKLNRMLADSTCGKTTYDEMVKLTDRDNYLSPERALEIGLIDGVLTKR